VAFWKQIQPGEARLSSHVMELCYRLPPGAQSLQVAMQLSKTLLYIHEYPPDAHRGFDIAATRVVAAVEGPDAAMAALHCLDTTKKHWLLYAVRCHSNQCMLAYHSLANY
jgi:hypothetical protein